MKEIEKLNTNIKDILSIDIQKYYLYNSGKLLTKTLNKYINKAKINNLYVGLIKNGKWIDHLFIKK